MGMCIKTFCLTSLFLFSQELIAQPQDFFPLQVGNVWQYAVYFQGDFKGYDNIRIISDTLMPNGKRYYQSTEPWRWGRIDDSLKTYRYDPSNLDKDTSTTELLMDKFNHFTGESWFSYKYGGYDSARAESPYVTRVFGEMVEVRVISYYERSGLWIGRWHYSRKHGLIYFAVEGGASYELTGARINGIDYGVIVSIPVGPEKIPENPWVAEPYPNPFNSSVTIQYGLPVATQLFIKVYNLLGKLIRSLDDKIESAGSHYHMGFSR